MALYRCASCGSQNVTTDTQAAGIKYDYVKGAVGTVLLGAGGAAAGITNKEQRVYKCADCGITLSYPMPENIKNMIDLGVTISEGRNHLSIRGVSVSWDELKKLYKNIETGPADEELLHREELKKRKDLRGIELLKSRGNATEDEFRSAVRELSLFSDKFAVRGAIKHKITETPEYKFNKYGLKNKDVIPFSENNLPTLIDYLAVLSFLNVFYTNYFRFIDYNESRDALKWGEDEDKKESYELFRQFLPIYISLEYYNSTRLYPDLDSDSFRRYVEENHFLAQLLIYHYKIRQIGPTDKKDDEDIVKNPFKELKLHSNPNQTKNCLIFPCTVSWHEVHFDIIFPKYKILNGALYYNQLTFKDYIIDLSKHSVAIIRRLPYDLDRSKEDYFAYYPEQKERFTSAISDYKKSIEQRKAKTEEFEEKKKDKKKTIANAQNQISVYKTELDQLRKKIFGKKKAEERIQELEQLIAQQQNIVGKETAEYEELDKVTLPHIESEKSFYARLYKEYDYFLIWHQIDEILD